MSKLIITEKPSAAQGYARVKEACILCLDSISVYGMILNTSMPGT